MELDEEELKATKNREKTADEMFEELGYRIEQEEVRDVIDTVTYTKRYKRDDFEYIKKIEINNPEIYSYPFIRLVKIFILVERYEEFDISMQELQAINKKVEELGWKKIK